MKQCINAFKITFISLVILFSINTSAQETKTNFKVMTYNIWNGFDSGKDTIRKENWINWIKSENPDVLALQELCGYDQEKLKKDALKWGHQYVQILKSEGYPVGLTSNKPIILKERNIDNFWHGFLHCQIYGIDFFVVHLSPADADFRLKEARIIADKIKKQKSDKFIILGDFNAHSPFDEELLKRNKSLQQQYLNDKNESNYSNLRLGEFDYSVISTFLAVPAIDVSKNFIEINNRYTFPTPALIGIYQTATEVIQNKQRIDYILTSPIISKSCKNVTIFNKGKPESLSDHYPIMAEFNFENK
ncbi:endonuclease/exonuclease/phosphatase family protein [Aureibaculum luteum]|uniref:endonuclease/exonuclease/phosphatase family protein n=1 Tax=Aureibaculum luteum TaxID=1548456 RepID=UPI000E54B61E|nr:endonuclease/exonuclease/phosphatase family protein [Aureibaculum luteum]